MPRQKFFARKSRGGPACDSTMFMFFLGFQIGPDFRHDVAWTKKKNNQAQIPKPARGWRRSLVAGSLGGFPNGMNNGKKGVATHYRQFRIWK